MKVERLMAAVAGLLAAVAILAAAAASDLTTLEPWCRQLARHGPAVRSQPDPTAPLCVLDAGLLAAGQVRLLLDTGPRGGPAAEMRSAWQSDLPELIWEAASGHHAQVRVPVAALDELARLPGLFHAGRPRTGLLLDDVVSAGVTEIGADAFVAHATDGDPIRIGIIDQGFAGAEALIGTELPAETRTAAFYGDAGGAGDLSGGGTDHGTACAEIIHDVAPGARLYLASMQTSLELQAAMRWMIDSGVDVISHSVGWFEGGGDGGGPLNEIVAEALDAGLLWVNAAGNQAQAHWGGPFRDTDGDGRHEFDAAGDETITFDAGAGGRSFTLVLTWDRWPYSTDLGYDIEIFEDGERVASTADLYSGRYAYRALAHARTVGRQLDIGVRRTTGAETAHLRLFRLDAGETFSEHRTPAGSLLLPADAPRVLAVGAYDVASGELEEFSARGPTVAGDEKPELIAPDRVATASRASFSGTSAAAPHAAGAAALLLASTPEAPFFDFRWRASELRGLLAAYAAPAPGLDPGSTSWGRLRLPRAPLAPAGRRLPLPACGQPPLTLRLRRPPPTPAALEIYDLLGRRIASEHGAGGALVALGATEFLWKGCDSDGRPVASGRYWVRLTTQAEAAPVLLLR